MATIIQEKYFNVFNPETEKRDIFRVFTKENQAFLIGRSGKSDGYAVIVSPDSEEMTLEEIAKIIEGCFKEESNFFKTTEKIFVLWCERAIKLVYKQTSILISAEDATAEKIIKKWNRGEKYRLREAYYIITGRRFAPHGKFDGYCKVLAISEKTAIKVVQKKFFWEDCRCLGTYKADEDTFLLRNASKYIDFKKMISIE